MNERPNLHPSPTLVLAWGNPSRGDDALGVQFADRLKEKQLPGIEILQDFQLQIEYSLDLLSRERVLFVDASTSCSAPYEFRQLHAERDSSYTSHSLSPQALLAVYEQVNQGPAPPSSLLTIRGYEFELGSDLSEPSRENLRRALSFAEAYLVRIFHEGGPNS